MCVRLANGTQFYANTIEVADLLVRQFTSSATAMTSSHAVSAEDDACKLTDCCEEAFLVGPGSPPRPTPPPGKVVRGPVGSAGSGDTTSGHNSEIDHSPDIESEIEHPAKPNHNLITNDKAKALDKSINNELPPIVFTPFPSDWVCRCGFRNCGSNECCGGRGFLGCKAARLPMMSDAANG